MIKIRPPKNDKLSQHINKYFQDKLFFDCTLQSGTTKVDAHRLLLCTVNQPNLQQRILETNNELRTNQFPVIFVNDFIPQNVLYSFVLVLYGNDVEVSVQDALTLSEIVEKLKLEALIKSFKSSIIEIAATSTNVAFEIYKSVAPPEGFSISDIQSCLWNAAFYCFTRSSNKIWKLEEFQCLSYYEIKSIVFAEESFVKRVKTYVEQSAITKTDSFSCETDTILCLLNWIAFDYENRESYLEMWLDSYQEESTTKYDLQIARLARVLKSTQDFGMFSDVVVKFKEENVQCHWVVLKQLSYFEGMSTSGMKEACENVIDLTPVIPSVTVFYKFIDYLYYSPETYDTDEDEMLQLLRIGQYFLFPTLISATTDFFCNKPLALTPNVALEIWGVLESVLDLTIINTATYEILLNVMLHNLHDLKQLDEFLLLDIHEIKTILLGESSLGDTDDIRLDSHYTCSKKVHVDSIIDAAMTWIEYDLEDREEYFEELLSVDKVKRLSPSYIKKLKSKIDTHNFFTNAPLQEAILRNRGHNDRDWNYRDRSLVVKDAGVTEFNGVYSFGSQEYYVRDEEYSGKEFALNRSNSDGGMKYQLSIDGLVYYELERETNTIMVDNHPASLLHYKAVKKEYGPPPKVFFIVT